MTTFLLAMNFCFFCQNKKLKNEISINKNTEGKHFSIIINIFEINKRLLFFNKIICLSLINRNKYGTNFYRLSLIDRNKYGTNFYQKNDIQDLGWGPKT